MRDIVCAREDELLEALERGFVGAELETHSSSCAACGELRLVAGALLDDRRAVVATAPVPSAGTMWLRLQLQQKREAELVARRALLIGQAATLLIALTVVLAIFGGDFVNSVQGWMAAVDITRPLLLALFTSLVLMPLAGLLAMRATEERPASK